MFDLRHYIDLILTAMEGASKDPRVDPYIPRFPAERRDKNTGQVTRVGDSGLSYGRLQNDVAAGDRDVVTTFHSILAAHPAFAHDRILRQRAFALAARKGAITGDFDPSLLALVGDALKSQEGRRLVNEQDERQIDRVFKDIDTVESAVLKRKLPGVFDPANRNWIAVAYAAAWANREDNLNDFAKYLAGQPVTWGTVQHQITGAPTLQDVIDYIGTQKQFRPNKPGIPGNNESFDNWQIRLVAAIKSVYVAHGLTLTAAEEAIIMTPRTSADPAAINPVGKAAPNPVPSPSAPGVGSGTSSPIAPSPSPGAPNSSPMLPLTPQSFPGGGGGGGTELEMDGRQASVTDEPATVPAAQRSSPLRDILTRAKQRADRALTRLTPTAFARTSATTAGLDAEAAASDSGGAQVSLPTVLPALDQGSTIDLGRADAARVEVGQIADSPDADSHLVAASFDTPTAPVGAPTNAAATRPGWPHSVTVGGRVFTREEVMAMTQVTISADGRSSKWTIPQPGDTPETAGLTEGMKEQVRELIREERRERDRRSGADYRSTDLFLFRR